ncbi:MAG: RNB domain-containing ribonuclease [Spirochaetales bacterium]
MEVKKKIYLYLENHDLFNQGLEKLSEDVFKGIGSSAISRKVVKAGLVELVADGSIKVQDGVVLNNMKLYEGHYYRNKNGRGYVVSNENGEIREYIVPENMSNRAFNDSTVRFVVEKGGENEYGEQIKEDLARIVKTVKRHNDLLYGTSVKINNNYYFLPDDSRFTNKIELTNNEFAPLAVNTRCSAHISTVESKNNPAKLVATITEMKQIFGPIKSRLAYINSVLEEFGMFQFHQGVIEEAGKMPTYVTEEDMEGREDFRDFGFFTIDPATTKDMDDAINKKRLIKNEVQVGYTSYVAIADVAHYVKEGTRIDKEAYNRGFSGYFAGGVHPMLPEVLSNGTCSLSEGEDRLAIVTVTDISNAGEILGYDIHEGIINSRHKFAYEEISAIHAGKPWALEKFPEYKEIVDLLYESSEKLEKHYYHEGALKIKGFEPTIVLNKEQDDVIDFRNDNYIDSHKVIEMDMVTNNTVIARFLHELGIENVARIHEDPDLKKIEALVEKLVLLGTKVELGNGDNKALQKMLKLIDELPKNKAKYSLLIRSLKKAVYEPEDGVGHSALALDYYTHFTSPIRRYPDLIEHRLVKSAIRIVNQTIKEHNIDMTGKHMSDVLGQVKKYAGSKLEKLSNYADLVIKCFHFNRCEENIELLSQISDLASAAIYMSKRVGTIQKGYVSAIDDNNITMTIYDKNDPAHSDIIEVLIPYSSNYILDGDGVRLVNKKTKNVLCSLDQDIETRITDVDVNLRKIIGSLELENKAVPLNDGYEMN